MMKISSGRTVVCSEEILALWLGLDWVDHAVDLEKLEIVLIGDEKFAILRGQVSPVNVNMDT